jgi:CBS domain containing-hemolysin-like protein
VSIDPLVDGILFLLAALLSLLIGAGEAAVEATSRNALEELEAPDGRVLACLNLKDRPEDFHASVQIALAFLSIAGAVLVLPHALDVLALLIAPLDAAWWRPLVLAAGLVLVASLLSGFFVVTGFLFARGIGLRYADALGLRLARPLLLLTRLLHVPQRALTVIANLLLRPTGDTARFNEPVLSEESLMDMIEESTKSGILDRTEHELIESIFEFTERTASEIMIPRTDIIGIDARMTPEQILDRVVQEGFTRMPVYNGSLDNIIGVIYSKDVLSLLEHKDLIILQDIIRPPFFVPGTKPIPELLREFQRRRIHLAVVVDEFGGTEGIITLEDILEEIVGEIRDEYDEEGRPLEVMQDGAVEVEGRMNIADFNDHAPFHIPVSEDYDTVGGFVTTVLGRIPDAGDAFTHRDLLVELLEVDEHRVQRVRITSAPADEEPNSPA